MKRKFIFAALMLCFGILNGCGAARPSKFYQLTLPNDKASGAASEEAVTAECQRARLFADRSRHP